MIDKAWMDLGFKIANHAPGSKSWTKRLPNGISINVFGAAATENECNLPKQFGPYSIGVQLVQNEIVSDGYVSVEVRAMDSNLGITDNLIIRMLDSIEAECMPTIEHPLINKS